MLSTRTIPACAVGLALCAILPAQTVPQKLAIGARELAPLPGLGESFDRLVARKQPTGESLHVAVQFHEGVKGAALSEALASAGVHLLEPLPGNGYIASVRLAGPLGVQLFAGNTSALAVHSIRALVPIEAEDRATEDVRRGRIADWAWTEDRGVRWVDLELYYHRDISSSEAVTRLRALGGRLIFDAAYFHRLTVRVPEASITSLAAMDWVRGLDVIPAPFVTTATNSESGALIGANVLHSELNLTGTGARIGIWDGGHVDERHPELQGRVNRVETNATRAQHATHVAGTMAAAGRQDPDLKGIAPAATVFSHDFRGDVPKEMLDSKATNNIDVSQNSWGFGISEFFGNCDTFGNYAAFERDMDKLIASEGLPIVFSGGNERDSAGCVIPARAGFYTAGRPAAAKNVIAVGAVAGDKSISSFSGSGPTRDGRLKPDVVALGVEVRSTVLNGDAATLTGTSMAAPAVSGLVALLRQRVREKDTSAAEIPALIRTVLMNTAIDLGNPGPDFTFGYGLPSGPEAVKVIDGKQYLTDRATAGDKEHKIEVPEGTPSLRVMLGWSDPEGPLNAVSALVNNLDLVLTAPDGTTRVLPLTLNPLDPKADARPAVNTRDNLEQVVVQQPAAGSWTGRVVASRVTTESQAYALSWSFAAVETPGCSTTIFPQTLTLREVTSNATLVVNRANSCGEWRAEAGESWIRPATGTLRGTAPVKVSIDANSEPVEREGVLRIGGSEVRIKQAPACFRGPIEINQKIEADLVRSDCIIAGAFSKLYTLQGTAGQEIQIDLVSADFDAFLILRGPTDLAVAADDDSGGGTNSRLRFKFITSGVYTIIASAFSRDETGRFELTLTTVEPHPAFGPVVPATVVGGCPATFDHRLADNGSRHGQRGELFYTNIYELPARRGQNVIADIIQSAFDTVMYLIGPSGRLVAVNDDFQATNRSRIDYIVPENGNYRLEVTSFEPRATGAYRLQLEGCTRPAQ